MGRSGECTKSYRLSRRNTFIRISTAIRRIGRRTTARQRTRLGSRQAGASPTFFVALGTSGTFMGMTRRLRELNPLVRCISLQPDSTFHGLEGWKHMPTAIVPAIYDAELADENLEVETEAAYRLVKRLAREEGLLVSPSAAAALLGCFGVAERIPRG